MWSHMGLKKSVRNEVTTMNSPDGDVVGTGDDGFAVGADGNTGNGMGVPFELGLLLASLGVPYSAMKKIHKSEITRPYAASSVARVRGMRCGEGRHLGLSPDSLIH